MLRALKEHWPEYVCEAAELGLFMISAGLFTILLFHPQSPAVTFLPDPFMRRMCVGIAMGGTAIALVFSPLGKRSGAHFNPAVTLTFWRLGKIKNWDALFYILAQFIGGIAGVLLVSLFAGMALSHPAVNYVVNLLGSLFVSVVFMAEFVIFFILINVLFKVSFDEHNYRKKNSINNYSSTFLQAYTMNVHTFLGLHDIINGSQHSDVYGIATVIDRRSMSDDERYASHHSVLLRGHYSEDIR